MLEFSNWESYAGYARSNGLAVLTHELMGSQGHWLKSDRLENSSVWNEANETNIKNKRLNQYKAFAQVRDFYKWVQNESYDIGHKVKWMKGAIGLVSAMAKNMENGNRFVSDDLEDLLRELNVAIQNATLDFFNDLLYGKYADEKLTGNSAMQWDIDLVNYEQGVVASPLYSNANKRTLKKLQRMVDKKISSLYGLMGIVGDGAPDFGSFGAHVTDAQARIDIPMLMMYPEKYRPTWKGFKGKLKSDGTLNKTWAKIFKDYNKRMNR